MPIFNLMEKQNRTNKLGFPKWVFLAWGLILLFIEHSQYMKRYSR